MANGKQVTNSDILNRFEAVRLEAKQDLQIAVGGFNQNLGRLESKFDNLEAGRLTRLEGRYNDLALQLQKATDDGSKATSNLNAKAVIVGLILTAFLYGIANAIVLRSIK